MARVGKRFKVFFNFGVINGRFSREPEVERGHNIGFLWKTLLPRKYKKGGRLRVMRFLLWSVRAMYSHRFS